MKLKNLFAMVAIALCAVACSEEDPKTPAQEAAEAVAGEYEGLMTMSVETQSAGESTLKLTLVAEENGTVKMSVPAMGSGSMAMPAFDVTGIEVAAAKDGSYTVKKDQFTASTESMNIEISNLSGTIKDKNAKITLSIKPGAMPKSITCTFDTQGKATTTPEESTPEESTAKGYKGMISMSVGNQSMGNYEATVTLSSVEGGATKISIPAIGEGRMALKAFDITGVNATKAEDGSYQLAVESTDVALDDITYKISNLTGTVNGDKVNITMKLKPGSMPMDITVTFTTEIEYAGKMSMSVNGREMGNADITLKLIPGEEGVVKISVPNITTEGSMNVKAFELTGVACTKSEDGTYALALEKQEIVLDDTKYTISDLTGTINGLDATIEMSAKFGAMPMPVALKFTTDQEQGQQEQE